MAYFLFILTTLTLFIRPAEIVPDLQSLPIYQCLILGALVCSLPQVLAQLSPDSLKQNPLTLAVLGVWIGIMLSHLAHGDLYSARIQGLEFSKTVVYYLLLVGHLNSPARLRNFAMILALAIIATAGLAVLQFHDLFTLPTVTPFLQQQVDAETGEVTFLPRIMATGLFQDPNDLAMICVAGAVLCFYAFQDRQAGPLRTLWLAPLLLLGYSIYLTHSRGGFIALVLASATYCLARYGLRKSFPLLAVALPALALLFGGRQTSLDEAMDGGTGQSRLQIWSDSFSHFRSSPVFGMGAKNFAEEELHATHNSFLEAFTELGFVGGTCFFALFYFSLWSLYRLRPSQTMIPDPLLADLRVPLLAMVAGLCGSMFSLSRGYLAPTYLAPGMVAAYLHLAPSWPLAPQIPFSGALAKRWAFAGAACLAATYVFTRVLVRFG